MHKNTDVLIIRYMTLNITSQSWFYVAAYDHQVQWKQWSILQISQCTGMYRFFDTAQACKHNCTTTTIVSSNTLYTKQLFLINTFAYLSRHTKSLEAFFRKWSPLNILWISKCAAPGFLHTVTSYTSPPGILLVTVICKEFWATSRAPWSCSSISMMLSSITLAL